MNLRNLDHLLSNVLTLHLHYSLDPLNVRDNHLLRDLARFRLSGDGELRDLKNMRHFHYLLSRLHLDLTPDMVEPVSHLDHRSFNDPFDLGHRHRHLNDLLLHLLDGLHHRPNYFSDGGARDLFDDLLLAPAGDDNDILFPMNFWNFHRLHHLLDLHFRNFLHDGVVVNLRNLHDDITLLHLWQLHNAVHHLHLRRRHHLVAMWYLLMHHNFLRSSRNTVRAKCILSSCP
mmetsp:Transcript_59154/g.141249  ORF Transcript_59154/g.141249 Transcript_59154/m.141249 type:complete len:230 (-) Transcript_59154:290-979(-)